MALLTLTTRPRLRRRWRRWRRVESRLRWPRYGLGVHDFLSIRQHLTYFSSRSSTLFFPPLSVFHALRVKPVGGGCTCKSVYLKVLILRMCMCASCSAAVTVLGERVPAPRTKDLSVLPSGIWVSVWAVPQSAGPCAQAPALSTRTHALGAHLTIAHAPRQPRLDRIMTRARARAHRRHPGKADLSLSWITDTRTASCFRSGFTARPVSASDSSPTRPESFTVELRSRSRLLGAARDGAHSYCREEEITFSKGRSHFTCIIHRIEINSHCIYSFLITSALSRDEYAWWLEGDTDWLSCKILLIKLNLFEQEATRKFKSIKWKWSTSGDSLRLFSNKFSKAAMMWCELCKQTEPGPACVQGRDNYTK